MNKKETIAKLIKYDHHYHTLGTPLVSDAEYDALKDALRDADPKNSYFKRVGADDDNAVTLPHYMGSLDKIKDTPDVLAKWVKKFPGDYIVSDKLDGVSALLHINNASVQLFTRGNGIKGRNITHILTQIQGIPRNIINQGDMAVRGELIIPKNEWKASYGSNARNVVAGLVNAKIMNKTVLKHIHFVAYDFVHPRETIKDAFKKMKDMGFETAFNKNQKNLSVPLLVELLQERKTTSNYEIDGIVVIDNSKKHNIKAGENPKYGFAFKSLHLHEQVEVTVREVEWNVSKDGFLKPRVLFDPVALDGVSISAATGFNAEYISSNKIGRGAKIAIIRSGGVIPKIERVILPAANGADMPDVPYDWNDTHIDVMIKQTEENKEQRLKEIQHFMTSLEIDKVAQGTIKKLYDAGFTTIPMLINMKKDDIVQIPGFKDKSADTVIASLKTIKSKPMELLMVASNIFGRGLGKKKIESIYNTFRNNLDSHIINNKALTINKDNIKTVEGIGEVTAKNFMNGLQEFKTFYLSLDISKTEQQEAKVVQVVKTNKLKNMVAVFTGFRDATIKEFIESNGGKIGSSVTKSTTLVIAKDPENESGSVKKAIQLGIAVVSRDQFVSEHMN
eukprot:762478-Hanusia_phi.AAC.12